MIWSDAQQSVYFTELTKPWEEAANEAWGRIDREESRLVWASSSGRSEAGKPACCDPGEYDAINERLIQYLTTETADASLEMLSLNGRGKTSPLTSNLSLNWQFLAKIPIPVDCFHIKTTNVGLHEMNQHKVAGNCEIERNDKLLSKFFTHENVLKSVECICIDLRLRQNFTFQQVNNLKYYWFICSRFSFWKNMKKMLLFFSFFHDLLYDMK